jgi:sporulation protein YunB
MLIRKKLEPGQDKESLRRKTRKRLVGYAAAALALWLAFYTLAFLDARLKPALLDMASLTAHQLAAEVIYKTMYQEILPETGYQELVIFQQDENSQLIYLRVNNAALGKLVTASAAAIKARLGELEQKVIEIPLGQATGVYLLGNRGPVLKIPVKPMGTVDIGVEDSFQQAGINQVKHTIYMDIQTDIQIVLPLVAHKERVSLKLPVADSIIVGKVPEVYLSPGSGLFAAPPSSGEQ